MTTSRRIAAKPVSGPSPSRDEICAGVLRNSRRCRARRRRRSRAAAPRARRAHGRPADLIGFAESAGLAAVAYGPDTQAWLEVTRNFWARFFRNFWRIRR